MVVVVVGYLSWQIGSGRDRTALSKGYLGGVNGEHGLFFAETTLLRRGRNHLLDYALCRSFWLFRQLIHFRKLIFIRRLLLFLLKCLFVFLKLQLLKTCAELCFLELFDFLCQTFYDRGVNVVGSGPHHRIPSFAKSGKKSGVALLSSHRAWRHISADQEGLLLVLMNAVFGFHYAWDRKCLLGLALCRWHGSV